MNYPKDIKAFYMRVNDDGRTVAAMDVLAPVSVKLSAGANARNGSTCWTLAWQSEVSIRSTTFWLRTVPKLPGEAPITATGRSLNTRAISAGGRLS
jgi:hypothetical protein